MRRKSNFLSMSGRILFVMGDSRQSDVRINQAIFTSQANPLSIANQTMFNSFVSRNFRRSSHTRFG